MKFLKKFATRAEYEAYMADNMENYPHVGYIADEGAVEYVKEAPPIQMDKLPLHFSALEAMTISFTANKIQYSLDNETWVDLPANTTAPTISAGGKMYFRAEGLTPTASAGIGTFKINGKCNVSGNAMSLLYGENFADKVYIEKTYSFYHLFYQQTSIVDAGNLILPATTLADYCYSYMFYGCSSLVSAPALPATIMNAHCYAYMYNGCSSLINASELPALSLANNCYHSMYNSCSNLVSAPELPATVLKSNCYRYMFYGCVSMRYIKAMFTTAPSTSYMDSWVGGVNSSGTFVKNAAATWEDTFGTSAIPTGWNVETATE